MYSLGQLVREVKDVKGMLVYGAVRGGLYVGDWRVLTPKLSKDLCRKCWLCVEYCPEGAVSKGEDGPVFDLRFCKGCGICAHECPAKAIRMVREV